MDTSKILENLESYHQQCDKFNDTCNENECRYFLNTYQGNDFWIINLYCRIFKNLDLTTTSLHEGHFLKPIENITLCIDNKINNNCTKDVVSINNDDHYYRGYNKSIDNLFSTKDDKYVLDEYAFFSVSKKKSTAVKFSNFGTNGGFVVRVPKTLIHGNICKYDVKYCNNINMGYVSEAEIVLQRGLRLEVNKSHDGVWQVKYNNKDYQIPVYTLNQVINITNKPSPNSNSSERLGQKMGSFIERISSKNILNTHPVSNDVNKSTQIKNVLGKIAGFLIRPRKGGSMSGDNTLVQDIPKEDERIIQMTVNDIFEATVDDALVNQDIQIEEVFVPNNGKLGGNSSHSSKINPLDKYVKKYIKTGGRLNTDNQINRFVTELFRSKPKVAQLVVKQATVKQVK